MGSRTPVRVQAEKRPFLREQPCTIPSYAPEGYTSE